MTYQIIRMTFPGNVHFGEGLLESSASGFSADTLFSALCCELANEPDKLSELVTAAKSHRFLISDAFPYCADTLFLPKPCVSVRSRTEADDGNSVRKKLFKKLQYIPIADYESYLHGDMTTERCAEITAMLGDLGSGCLTEHVSIPRDPAEDKPEPYAIGGYRFHENCGLWFILGAEDSQLQATVTDLLTALGLSGIGGKRSAGYGRFTFCTEDVPAPLLHGLECSEQPARKMTLSICLPQESELDSAMKNASYLVMRRSGFVGSYNYAVKAQKKQDLYVLQSGSCFADTFCGDVYDVSAGGNHQVWRYAVPLFFGLEGDA